MKHNLETLIQEFLEYMEVEKGRSKNTVKNYSLYLRRFGEFSEYAKPEKITEKLIEHYGTFLKDEVSQKGLEKNTQNYHLIALREFLKYIFSRGFTTLNPKKIKLAKIPERKIDYLDENDLARLLDSPLQTDEDKIIQLRDRAILELLFSTGLRVSELSSLTKEDIDVSKDEFTIMNRGPKIRILKLTNQAKYCLERYLKKRKDFSRALFVRHDKAKGAKDPKNLTTRSVQRISQRYAKMCGIQKTVTPQIFRNTFATRLLAQGTDIALVQSLLGHISPMTTKVYKKAAHGKIKDTLQELREKETHQ